MEAGDASGARAGDAGAAAGGASAASRGPLRGGGAAAGPAGAKGPLRGAAEVPGRSEGLGACEARRLRKEQRREENPGWKREKRKALKRRKQARQEMLGAMGEEERAAFVERERRRGAQLKAELTESLQWAHESGSPKVVINCSFGEAMCPKERRSLAKQAQMAYTAIRDHRSKLQLHLTSVGTSNPALTALEEIGFRGWVIHTHEAPYWELFDRTRVVVLSPDADEDLDELSHEDVYVIGGLVDGSVRKNESRAQAEEHGLGRLRRLPLKRYGPPGAHPVLNIDCVVRILTRMAQAGSDWETVLADCLPRRHAGGPSARQERKQRALDRRLAEGGVAGAAAARGAADATVCEGTTESPAAGAGQRSVSEEGSEEADESSSEGSACPDRVAGDA
ncbi:unnamed protein product [Prorocentrum cordatum]|uniref:tRNA (guanine(9)-N(1))-methyltransferase n=1 Tax=Prorocentrum cordatum TaxID=2364126 RepID=A0ABN9WCQ3_9DINO|nr:unnamed protein product [Polarella glacialis]